MEKIALRLLLAMLLNITPIGLWASESKTQNNLTATVESCRAAQIARDKILTRVDAACIADHITYSHPMTMKQFRESRDFQQRTGPHYHSQSDSMPAVIQNPELNGIFRQQIHTIARELVSKQLQPPWWVYDRLRMWANEPYGWIVIQEKQEGTARQLMTSDGYEGYADSFVPASEWFARRAAVINGYYNDKSLFPAGAPAQILPPQPQVVSKVDSCVLQ